MKLQLAAIILLVSTAAAEPRNHVHMRLRTTPGGRVATFAAPTGLVPADLIRAYAIPTDLADTPTVAIVDAYGYANLESDLATYRAQFGLPPCTRASGCLTIVNQRGAQSPLPLEGAAADGWQSETALDVDMISAACPRCKIVVVEADDSSLAAMDEAQLAAADRGPTVISDSFGRFQAAGEDLSPREPYYDHPGIATFVSSGDSGFNEGGNGPHYPSTSAHVIAVGGTYLEHDGSARGFSEVAWTSGGSSCSRSIAKLPSQPASPCAFRAAVDVSAVADGPAGIAMYYGSGGGWLATSGTSAAAPFVAAIFAATGHGAITHDELAKLHAFRDITVGSNGACGGILCNAGTGWDGPTGYGTPDGALLAGGGDGSGDPSGPGEPGQPGDDDNDGSSVVGGCDATGNEATPLVLVLGVILGARRRRG